MNPYTVAAEHHAGYFKYPPFTFANPDIIKIVYNVDISKSLHIKS